ncbi:NADH dehydrogenase (quinone) subunit D [Akkermansia sp. N21116]|jgi:NADH-quinone oxidoreductase subunit D|uniref:NADH dehydrogenase (quinone) subunit D n=1 Tax=Akkermansia sp. N21116 TaxID=3040764 RepID=UPI00244EB320|nr:NADH dehydrogenase (quinone) subunit D [Akkermansia sp. N21116]WPX40004.1 NADH dehydrogenase (quinone) subunit D [Akkermansia sp. N21116]
MKTRTKTFVMPDPTAGADYLAETLDTLGETVTLNMGPSHPATHGVLRLILELDGEEVLSCDPVIGHLHRGIEKIGETIQYNQFVPYTDRFDYLAPISNNIAYACAVEKLLDWELPERGQALRVLALELSRIGSHLLDVGVGSMDVGAMTVFLYTYNEREKVHNFYEQLTGARFTSSFTRIGGQIHDMPEGMDKEVLRFCDECSKTLDEADNLLLKNNIFMNRMKDIGIISRQDALGYGLTGIHLRASGVQRDLRKLNPYLGYENYEFDVPVGEIGDCYDRYLCRLEELRQSIRIIRQVLQTMPQGPINMVDQKGTLPEKRRVLTGMEELIRQFMSTTEGVNAPAGQVYFAAENPKGELGFMIDSKGGGIPNRLRMRSPSFCTLSILPKLIPGHLVSDIPAILGSFDFVQGECDR